MHICRLILMLITYMIYCVILQFCCVCAFHCLPLAWYTVSVSLLGK